MALLTVSDVSVAYGDVVAVRDVSIEVGSDELVVILGANGAGKTSLVSAIVGWIRPHSGRVAFDGHDLGRLEPWRRAELGIGFVPEGGRVFGDLTVEENLRVSRPTPDGLGLAFDLFPVLAERRRQVARTLSGGQRQMLALARALASQPRLLIVDEASTGLMPTLVERVFDVLADLRRDGLPVLLVEQNTEAIEIADRGYVMAAGEVVRHGAAADLGRDPEVRRAYLGG
jgi:branched-chain amino acid transport system ATP-binding protein